MAGVALPALRKLIDERRLAPVHLFVGEDVKLVDRMVDAVEATIDPADRPFAVDRVYAGESGASPVDIVASASSLPMLGDRRIVVVFRAERWLKPKRAAAAREYDADDGVAAPSRDDGVDLGPLEAYLDAPASSSTLLFVAADIDRSRRFTKRLVDKAAVTEFGGLAPAGTVPGRQDAVAPAADLIRSEMTRVGRTIDGEAARLLARRAGGDITKLRGDLERLLLFVGDRKAIVADDVMEISVEADIEDDWAVVNAIAAGDAARALSEAAKRLERGDSPHQMIGQLRWWVSARLAEADPARVKPALDALLRTDLALKSSGGDDRVLVERLVFELTGRPLQQRGGWR